MQPVIMEVAYNFEEQDATPAQGISISLVLPSLLWLIGFFWYIPYYTKDKPEKYFKKIGLVQAALEYQFSRKLFFVIIAVSIFSTVAVILTLYLIAAVYAYILHLDTPSGVSRIAGGIMFFFVSIPLPYSYFSYKIWSAAFQKGF
jgi:hypothetical protein